MAPVRYADDDLYTVKTLVRLRTPSLIVGMVLGIALSLVTSRFEEVITTHVEIAFFIPFVVYMASAVGSQTQSIYTRDLKSGKARFTNYLAKELGIGSILGVILGVVSWFIVAAWFSSSSLALAVGLSMFASIATAPLVALITTQVLQLEHQDPAVGAGPIATVIQDTISVTLYGLIATHILLS